MVRSEITIATENSAGKTPANITRRLLFTLPLMALAGYCLVGFIGTLEPMPRIEQWLWRAIYITGGGGAVVVIAWMWLGRRSGANPARA